MTAVFVAVAFGLASLATCLALRAVYWAFECVRLQKQVDAWQWPPYEKRGLRRDRRA